MQNYRDRSIDGDPEDPMAGPVQHDIPEEPSEKQEVPSDQRDEEVHEEEIQIVIKRKKKPPAIGNNRRYVKKIKPDNDLDAVLIFAKEFAIMTELVLICIEKCPDSIFEVDFPVIDNERLAKKYFKNRAAFVTIFLKKKRVEILERNLNKEDKELIRQASGR